MREHAVIACVHSSSRYVQLKTKQGAAIAPIQPYHYKGAVGVCSISIPNLSNQGAVIAPCDSDR